METILVSGASGVVGYGTLRSLRKAKTAYNLIGTSIYDDSVAPAFCDVFELAPLTSSERYIDWLCGIIKKHKVDLIIPGIEDDMLKWNAERQTLAKTGVKSLLNNPELIALCGDKWSFYEKLKENGSEVRIESRLSGTFDELRMAYGLPFLLKPRRGFASKGIVVIESEEMFERHKSSLGVKLMAQPIVGDKETEYTISAFFDAASTLLCSMSLRRKLSPQGFTEKAEVASPDGVEQAIQGLAKLFKPVGPTNFQFRVHKGELKLLEINPRISSATSIRAAFGYNESSMAADYFLHNSIPVQPKLRQGYAVRYTEDYIVYDSHTI